MERETVIQLSHTCEESQCAKYLMHDEGYWDLSK